MSQRVSKKNNYESISEPRFALITQSAAAVFGVAVCASVAVSTKGATEKTVRLARIVMCDYHKDHPFFACMLMTSISGCGEPDIW